jgi:beta-glucosidase
MPSCHALRLSTLLASSILLALSGCRRDAEPAAQAPATPAATGTDAALSDWPKLDSAIKPDPAIEARIKEILAGMTLRQKVGQMTQPEIKTTTPEDVKTYYLGSVLNGGGSWPAMNKHAAVSDWLALSDMYYDASMATDLKTPIPVIWGTDAVHGHSNVYGATIFPHNIGLGAAHDPALIQKIAAATGKAVRATGVDWLFAPAVPVVQDLRWGRTYESYSEDPALVREYSVAYTKGLQGTFADDANAIASVKHFLGDGGTEHGKDQGITRVTLRELINTHGVGYFGAIGAGAQTVMASFNSWVDADSGQDHGKMHGIKLLLTDALKTKMGFDGFIVSDWNAIGQLPGCTNASCAQAINAGIDMVMVPDDWKAFIDNTVKQVEAGEIPMARIDDAVTRILRVKLRAGLFDGKKPSANAHAGKLESVQDRELAREAVRKSLVLLKNNLLKNQGNALPLARGKKLLVVGASADSISNQTGGWSLTWQGTENTNADFPHADSLLAGFREAAGDGNVTYSADASGVDVAQFDAVVAVLGETPYAEGVGDIAAYDTVSHARRFPADLKVLQAVAGKGKPVVTVLLSGRPVYANDLINLSDAFVAAWLPGTEGKGVADVLFAGTDAKPAHDFSGTLSFSWPGVACPGPRAVGKDGAAPQFARGYGLSYAKPGTVDTLLPDATASCGEADTLVVFDRADAPTFALHVGNGGDVAALGADVNQTLEWPQGQPLVRVRTVQVNTQQDAKEVTWLGKARFFSRNPSRNDLRALAKADAALVFDMALLQAPTSKVSLLIGCGPGCEGGYDLTPALAAAAPGDKRTIKLPLQCFGAAGAKLEAVEMPFVVEADAPFAAAFANIRIAAGAAKDADALKCP